MHAAHEGTSEPVSLARRAVRGSLWAAIGAYGTFVVNFAGIAVLARYVSPADFGSYALAQSYNEIVLAIGLFPFAQAVVQLGNLRAIGDTALIMGVILRLAQLLLSVPLAFVVARYNGRTVGILFFLFALLAILDGLRSNMSAVMERNLHYRGMSIAKVAAGVAGSSLAVGAAILGFGSYALVFREALVVALVLAVYLVNARRWNLPTGRSFDRATARHVWRFSKALFWVNSLERILARLDRVALGNLLGVEALGYFHQSKYLATLPQAAMAPANMQVAIATYTKVRDDPPRLARAFDVVQYFVLRVVPLAGLAMVLFPEEILRTMYGARWLPAAPTFRILGIYATLLPILEGYRTFSVALEQWAALRWSIIAQAVVLVAALAVLVPRYGAIGAAWATCIRPVVGFAILGRAVSRRIHPATHGRVPPVLGAFAAALGGGWALQQLVTAHGGTRMLLLKLGVASFLYVLGLLIIERKGIFERVSYLRRAWR